jgi:succinylglutamate desuccinylase
MSLVEMGLFLLGGNTRMKNIKVIEKKGKFEGKRVVILTGVHGNEKAGVEGFERLIPDLEIESGSVCFIVGNLKALEEGKRFIDRDLNRCFFDEQGRDIKKSLEGKTAKEIMPFLRDADFVLDLHQSNSEKSEPFVICDYESIEFAKFLPASKVSVGWDSTHPGASAGFVDLHGGKGLALELGFIGDIRGVEVCEKAILNFLNGLRLVKIGDVEEFVQEVFEIKKVHRNIESEFVKTREFADFEVLSGEGIIGMEGDLEVRGEEGDRVLFVRNRRELGSECFVLLKMKGGIC